MRKKRLNELSLLSLSEERAGRSDADVAAEDREGMRREVDDAIDH